MTLWMIALGTVAVSLVNSATAADVKVLATFDQPDSIGSWKSVNYGVMGGVSEGGFKRTDAKTLLFSGTLSLENNGGFASIRTEPRAMDLTGLSALVVKARGDGRTYWIDLRVARQQMASSYRAELPTVKGEWREIRIPLRDFQFQSFGRRLAADPINPATVNSVGFTLADKKAGPFILEIESIKAIAGEDPKPAVPAGQPVVDVAAAKPLTPRALIELAIDRGVSLFNADQLAACVAVYEVACESLRVRPEVTEASRQDLDRALQDMRAEKSVREKAWILRRSLDRTFARE
jgi:NADH dehydrogenase [ubiquinone] 1 alpha subcomplex assembly factor 1